MLVDYMVEEVQAVQEELREYALEAKLDLDHGDAPLFEVVQVVCSSIVYQSSDSCGPDQQ